MTTVSPFARSSAFEEPRLAGREQTVRIKILNILIDSFSTEMLYVLPVRLRKCTAFPRVF